ncbi:MAG: Group 1 glycosyl transferase [Microgenomates group bacterium GW2011_GWC1_38_12]|uniref:Glycosyl transferase family 1 domain-containing protein n=1 Tax=Candidatus Vogelbacteria bacterium RIFOXYB1_FULL_42_16 TaxID=1802436 RepID=A0A1G2QEW8_9BACT|nr:MAG: Group 1 glycosyl transferase [Microgenomates group bacterium GW2011_GWC1_38_12]KKS78149.1 MAG: Group 1 glycosyl transferase [Parcubacteria group bacterium GW2011_GWB1_42_9]OHA59124.1 MAG: hypothetical protein A2370_02985 [Candidatus Vogelbacteria bacterium RIFOXYB1_FULL_42_16]
MKTICFFGIYDRNYSRNRILMVGFKKNNWQVIECLVDPKKYHGWKKYWQLLNERKLLNIEPDLVLVAYPGQTMVWLARLLFLRKLLVFDAFTSLYDSNVFDRRLYGQWSWRGGRDFLLDWHSLFLADRVLVDTHRNAKYFQKTFRIKAKKFIRVFVGTTIGSEFLTEEKRKKDDNIFLVHFHGHYIPLQGIEYIVKAAKILEKEKDIKFRIIGHGQEFGKISQLVERLKSVNIEFSLEVSFVALKQMILESDLVLGIFGITPKAERVIPNKVFEGLALGKAVLTADTPAIRELLIDGENVLLCQAGNPKDLAQKIIFLHENPRLAEKIATNGQNLIVREINPQKLVKKLIFNLNI